MKALHIRDVPESVIEALKRRAARHRRSAQQELRQILAGVAEREPPATPLPPIGLTMVPTDQRSTWGRDEIYGDDGR